LIFQIQAAADKGKEKKGPEINSNFCCYDIEKIYLFFQNKANNWK
jgi:hypothetical protein